MRRGPCLVLLVATLAAAGCGSKQQEQPSSAATTQLRGAQARPATPAAAAALSVLPESRATQRRLGYVDLARVNELGALGGARVVERVLATTQRPTGQTTAVSAGDPAALTTRPAEAPEINAIMRAATSGAQSCLNDATVLTIRGPESVGKDSAIGVGLRRSKDAPAGVQVLICAAPHYRRDIHAVIRRAEARYGDLDGMHAGEDEIGEREIASATLPAHELPRTELLALLSGGERLTSLLTPTTQETR